MPRFPNLFIIGAQKAGTSSLHEYLHQHPQIFMSRFKEPQYFAPHKTREGFLWGQGNPCPEPGIDWYLRLFEEAGDVKYAGESSVSYTARPIHVDCEKRIYDFNPAARIIFIMRDPIERAISHYWWLVAAGCEDRDILTAFRRRPEYIARSDYAMQLQPYLHIFGAQAVYSLTLEELNARPKDTFSDLFNWLGVDRDVAIDTSERHNVRGGELRQTRRYLTCVDKMLKHWRWRLYEPRIPALLPRLMQKVAYRRVNKRDVDVAPAIRYLRPILQESTGRLSRLLGRDFPLWTTTLRSTEESHRMVFADMA